MSVKSKLKYQPSEAKPSSSSLYDKFDTLDGRHPWMTEVPDGFVAYPVRNLKKGKVSYFNFPLAKEMGLIPANHPHELTKELEQKILGTFSLQIINEYDQKRLNNFDSNSIRPQKYMATRYLQLQHKDKKGKTSGDGRGIWNGTITYQGKTWDVSSRGTGVTCLAPGAVEAQKPLKTGNHDFGYGCGQAELDELISAAILAESIHLQGLSTERVLCVIDLGKKVGIGVRAAPNLIRPAHIFLYLKQSRWAELKRATDYLIDRQIKNGEWKIKMTTPKIYFEMTKIIAQQFARFAALLEMEYVFAWLDWDGDNVLANAGIIDYGSVRQFGARHDKYRYDDVERFSTTLSEQRSKAKLIVKVFLQLAHYLTHLEKKPLTYFDHHSSLSLFDSTFEKVKKDRILYKMGFDPLQRKLILKSPKLSTVLNRFVNEFEFLERFKISGKVEKVADGVNHRPRFNLRNILSFIPTYYLKSQNSWTQVWIPDLRLFKASLTEYARVPDQQCSKKISQIFHSFQANYKELVEGALNPNKFNHEFRIFADRARKLNSPNRISGNALIELVHEIIQEYRVELRPNEIQMLIDSLLLRYQALPESNRSSYHTTTLRPHLINSNLYERIADIIHKFREDI